jgi:tRNA pseudouridine55 synthase
MNGFFLIDKPEGIPSFDCVKILRKVTGVKRIGFAGTLDPLATGLMIVAIGEATKLLTYLEKQDKVYEAAIYLGASSSTFDAKGEITEHKNFVAPSVADVEKIIENEFIGLREQVPPIFSAIKIQGKRAYALARKGEKPEMKKRAVNFFDIKIKSFVWPRLELSVHCSSGTYIRSLAHDLGKMLGCGGYVEELRRTKIGQQKLVDAVKLDDLNEVNFKKYLVQPQEIFPEWQQLELTDVEYSALAEGRFIDKSISGGSPIMAIYKHKCAGVLEIFNGKLKFLKKFNMMA